MPDVFPLPKVANENHLVMVDDNEGDIVLAQWCYEHSRLGNPWLAFLKGREFVSYLASVKSGTNPMPALVLLDINMSGMNGLEIIEWAKSDPFFARLPPFVVLSSSTDPRDRERAAALGAAFTTKTADLDRYIQFFDSLGP